MASKPPDILLQGIDALRRVSRHMFRYRASIIAFFAVLLLIYGLYLPPPSDFPAGKTLSIPRGATLAEAARLLEEGHVVRSAHAIKIATYLFGGGTNIDAGDYRFPSPINALRIAYAITVGNFGRSFIRVTVPEGATVREIGALFALGTFTAFDYDAFLAAAKAREGFLFPDTYLFASAVTSDEVITTMQKNFLQKIGQLEPLIQSSGHSLADIVIMASLLEKEARSNETRRTIAGILWRRLEIDMPLQVDAVFGYIRGADTYSPSLEDLKIKSPYNTYLYPGLPPGPIGNPGLAAIEAAATPIASPYLYYLTDTHGIMHYSLTYEEHLKNKRKYLP